MRFIAASPPPPPNDLKLLGPGLRFAGLQVFEDPLLRCVRHGQRLSVLAEVSDTRTVALLRLISLPNLHHRHEDQQRLLLRVASWSLLPVYTPRNDTIVRPTKTDCSLMSVWDHDA